MVSIALAPPTERFHCVLMAALLAALSMACSKSSGSTPRSMVDGGGDRTDGRPAADTMTVPCDTDRRVNGQACSCSAQCDSRFCADGVCCETACTGACSSCNLPSSLGICAATPAGGSPRMAGQCKAEDRSTCGLDGTCDGTGQCRNHVDGTVCKPGTCDLDAVMGTYTCDGAKVCRLDATKTCAPFSCNPATNDCFAKCSSDAECVSGRKCVAGSCGPKMNGSVCEQGSECASQHCADGVCCNGPCDGACRACNLMGQVGSCRPLAEGLSHALCSQQGAATCGTTGLCDGFGSCAVYPANSFCGASVCSGLTAVSTARVCNGVGACAAATVQSCGSYRCANGRCNSTCATAADCADGVACVNNNCGPKVDGQACTANADCLNLHCVRDAAGGAGVCCNTDCVGACRSCAVVGSVGRCTSVAAGAVDPRGMCVDMTAATCGTDGRCNGAGACRSYAVGTVCAAETCVTDVYTGPGTCNAVGQCAKPAPTSCSPYHCNANRCFTSCTTSAQCIVPNTCGMDGVISSCGLKPMGATCSAGDECSSRFCAQGVCCHSACNTACRACDLAGTVGTCSNVVSGADPRGLCAAQAQSTCGTTGQCSAGQCARWPAGTQCRAASCADAATRVPPSTCNTAGVCAAAAAVPCTPGRCDSAMLACSNVCTTDAQCTSPAVCANGTCSLPQPNGSVCTAASACMSGFCVDGRCCGSACTGACQTCNNAAGTCGAAANGTADALCGPAAPPCGVTGLCSGGACATTANGTACGDGNACNGAEVCQAGTCAAGTPVVCAAMDDCHLPGTCTAGACSNPVAPDAQACGAGPLCSGGGLKAQNQCSAGVCVAGATTPCPSGVCADTTSCAPELPQCGVLQDCTGSPAPCACPGGTSCGPLLPICL